MSREYLNEAEIKLVDALRSGKYTQAQQHLKTEFGYCCLGVACDLLDSNIWVLESDRYYWEETSTILPSMVQTNLDWATKNGKCSFLDRDGGGIVLSELNDEGYTFDKIADIIEAGLVITKKDIYNV